MTIALDVYDPLCLACPHRFSRHYKPKGLPTRCMERDCGCDRIAYDVEFRNRLTEYERVIAENRRAALGDYIDDHGLPLIMTGDRS